MVEGLKKGLKQITGRFTADQEGLFVAAVEWAKNNSSELYRIILVREDGKESRYISRTVAGEIVAAGLEWEPASSWEDAIRVAGSIQEALRWFNQTSSTLADDAATRPEAKGRTPKATAAQTSADKAITRQLALGKASADVLRTLGFDEITINLFIAQAEALKVSILITKVLTEGPECLKAFSEEDQTFWLALAEKVYDETEA